jgi:hypothetical protein
VKRRREISHQNRETTSDLENVVFKMKKKSKNENEKNQRTELWNHL